MQKEQSRKRARDRKLHICVQLGDSRLGYSYILARILIAALYITDTARKRLVDFAQQSYFSPHEDHKEWKKALFISILNSRIPYALQANVAARNRSAATDTIKRPRWAVK